VCVVKGEKGVHLLGPAMAAVVRGVGLAVVLRRRWVRLWRRRWEPAEFPAVLLAAVNHQTTLCYVFFFESDLQFVRSPSCSQTESIARAVLVQ
jgi:hypothetical protein